MSEEPAGTTTPADADAPGHTLVALSWRRGLTLSFAIIFVVEALIMGAFATFDVEFDTWTEALIDASSLAIGAGVLAWFLVIRPLGTEITRERDIITRTQGQLHTELERRDEDARIQRAFEWTNDEAGVLDVVRRSTRAVLPQHKIELWMADSSRAHLRRPGFEDDADPEVGCGVSTPRECVAVQQGHMLQFASSEDLDACPLLRRSTLASGVPCSAICTPVTVLGESVGVLHAFGPQRTVVPDETTRRLQAVSSSSGNRLSLLRALADSQLQASVDYLTGLLNRRSLRGEVGSVIADGQPYAVMMLDLDHFKRLNDTYGHDMGDRALRVFADAVANSIDDHVLAGRWGGEEFVVFVPNSDAAAAAPIAEAVRQGVVDALRGGNVPTFTLSIGIADSTQAPGFEEALNLADEALFHAKNTGRDRVVMASELGGLEGKDLQVA